MKRDNKQRLFEIVQRIDDTYKPKLNESINEEIPVTDQNKKSAIGHFKSFIGEVNEGNIMKTLEHAILAIGVLPFFMDNEKYLKYKQEIDKIDEELYSLTRNLSIEFETGTSMNESEEEFVPNGTYTVSNAGGYEIMLSPSGDAAKVRDAYGSDNPQTSDWLEIEFVPTENGDDEAVIDPKGYNIPLSQVMKIN
jgi:hypothetical protein